MSNEAKALKQQGTKRIDLQKLLALGALVILFVFFFIAAVFGNNVNGLTFITNVLESSYFVGFFGAWRDLCDHYRRDRPFHRNDHDVRCADRGLSV